MHIKEFLMLLNFLDLYFSSFSFYYIICVMTFLLGAQIQYSDLRLLTGKYVYKIHFPQLITYISILFAIGILYTDVWHYDIILLFAKALFFFLFFMFSKWLLGKMSPRSFILTVLYRLVVILSGALVFYCVGDKILFPFLLAGIWLRNSFLGVVHGKPFFFANRVRRKDKHYGNNSIPEDSHSCIDVTQYGIFPNTNEDVLDKVQALIDDIGQQGGGVVFFPKGRYLFNKKKGRGFLQINFSNITIEGECDKEGNLLSELINCGPTTCGVRNPWLSPFFITTGEALQPSNTFWGLQFRSPSGLRTESSSLSDPGSDGALLTPKFLTKVVDNSMAGSSMLSVEDSSVIGKYILLGMYNTSPDGNLLRELLGVEEFRTEWITARRAGPEGAPSFQWLVEVKRIIDNHTVELCRPLLRDCLLKYDPRIFHVDLLENIHIRNLRISSKWNGLFRHHGFPIYYSVAQAQEMDYGWNAINIKRAAHSSVEGVEIRNFTNPLYVQDSRDVTVENISVSGYDGHQGIKVYCHTCDCMFRHIDFYSHFADMMGGEGNAYANVFKDISYRNPVFKPVDFDFHGFSEGPMSPPAYNVFEQVHGFRYIKGAGAVFMQPACGVGNVWKDVIFEGGKRGEHRYYAMSYRVKSGLEKYVTAFGYTVVMMMKRKKHSINFAQHTFKDKLKTIDQMSIPQGQHEQFFPGCRIE